MAGERENDARMPGSALRLAVVLPRSALALPALVVLFAGVGVSLVLTGPTARAAVEALGGGDHTLGLWNIGKWPLIAAIFAGAFLLFHFAVVKPEASEGPSLSGGQILVVAVWGLTLGGLAFYVAYGSLGVSTVSVLWLLLFSVLYYATPSLRIDAFGTVMPGLALALGGWLTVSGGVAVCAAVLDPFHSVYGAAGLAALILAWLWLSNLALLLGTELNLQLAGRLPLAASAARASPAAVPHAEPPRDETAEAELERVVRAALADDAAHRGMWSALPGGPDDVPELLTELECDLNDWGFAYGVAWAAAKARYPGESDRWVVERALGTARAVFGEYCAGEDWSDRFTERDLGGDAGKGH
jgi:uncharacterized BrkB/YihY/UPF0761 family membrane protein